MILFEIGGNLWAKLRGRSRRFELADRTPEQTHMNHALVIVLLFGTIAAGLAMMFDRAGDGFRLGLLVGLVYYLCREIDQRAELVEWYGCEIRGLRWIKVPTRIRTYWHDNPWDGVCDVVIPCWIVLPTVVQSLALLWALSAVVAVLYFLLRPIE